MTGMRDGERKGSEKNPRRVAAKKVRRPKGSLAPDLIDWLRSHFDFRFQHKIGYRARIDTKGQRHRPTKINPRNQRNTASPPRHPSRTRTWNPLRAAIFSPYLSHRSTRFALRCSMPSRTWSMASNIGSWVTGLGWARVTYVLERDVKTEAFPEVVVAAGRRRRRGRAQRELILLAKSTTRAA